MELKDALELILKSNFVNIKVFEDHIEVDRQHQFTFQDCGQFVLDPNYNYMSESKLK